MTADELTRVRAALLARIGLLAKEGAVTVKVERNTPLSSAQDDDLAPYLEMDQAIASGRNRARAQELALLNAAVARFDADPDAYGICTGCEEEIAPRRLELMPQARLCVACQSKGESRGAGRKKVTDYV